MVEKHLKKCSTYSVIREDANENNPEIPPHTRQHGMKPKKKQDMLF